MATGELPGRAMDKLHSSPSRFSLFLRALSLSALVLGIGLAASQLTSTAAKVAAPPKAGSKIGTLSIPTLKQTWPIIQGTGTNDLKKGVGHFIQSVLPGANDNCVLSGHRTTVFAKLGKVKIGDQLIVRTSTGTYTYQVKRIRIVHQDDKTVIVPTNHAVLTLTTCYPFRYIGSAPDRYIVSADLVGRK